MNAQVDLLMDSLEIAAERHGDLVPLVYQRFYARYPQTRQMFGRDAGNLHQGHMFNGMLNAVLEQARGCCHQGSIDAWVADHALWGVEPAMFSVMFDALHDTLCDCLGPDWTPPVAAQWRGTIDVLAGRFDQACQATGLRR